MTHDTEWPASSPHSGKEQAGTDAGWLVWCIRYIAEEARRTGFDETAAALEAVELPRKNDRY